GQQVRFWDLELELLPVDLGLVVRRPDCQRIERLERDPRVERAGHRPSLSLANSVTVTPTVSRCEQRVSTTSASTPATWQSRSASMSRCSEWRGCPAPISPSTWNGSAWGTS